MRRRAALVLVSAAIVLLSSLLVADGTALSDSGAGTQTAHSLVHDGLTRSYLKYVPPNLPSEPIPLVIVLHGGGQSANQIAQPAAPGSHWKAMADRDKFIVVYPDGVNNQWHDCRSDAHDELGMADDVGFLSALIDDVAGSDNIDLTRVYSTGASNGGMMSFRLAFELTGRIAAIGAVIANLPQDPEGECRPPDRPITVVIMDGDIDTRVPWNGGCVWSPSDCRGTVISAEATRDYWIAHNDTGAAVDYTRSYPDTYANDGPSTVSLQRYDGGTDGTQVAFFRVAGGGHQDPSTHHLVEYWWLLGPQNRDIDGSEEMWAIMREHSLATNASVGGVIVSDLESSPAGTDQASPLAWILAGTAIALVIALGLCAVAVQRRSART